MTATYADKARSATKRTKVAGFPEIVARGAKCRLCALSETHPDVLHAIHAAMARGVGGRPLAREATRLLEAAGEAAVHHQVVGRHHAHVLLTAEQSAAVITAPGATVTADAALGPMAAATAAAARARDHLERDDDTDDYFEGWALFERLRAHIDEAEGSGIFRVSKETSAEDAARAAYAKTIHLSTIKEMRALLVVINKIKNGNRFTRELLDAHGKTFAMMLSASLKHELGTVLESLGLGHVDEAKARLHELVELGEIATLFEHARTAALEKSASRFRIGGIPTVH